jgi:hypothetical protein
MDTQFPVASLSATIKTSKLLPVPAHLEERLMPDNPSATLPGTVNKIIKSPHPGVPEKAEISVEGADDLYREIRIENTLTDEKGNEVKLKPGAEVEVTIEADPKATVPKNETASAPSPGDKNHKAKSTGKS